MKQDSNFSSEIELSHPGGKKVVGYEKSPLVVAEIGLNHNGELSLAREMVAAAADVGADFVKFQAFELGDLVSPAHQESELGEIFSRCRLSRDQMAELFEYAHQLGVGASASPFGTAWADWLEKREVPFLKIASGDIVNPFILNAVAKADPPLLLSTGAANREEIRRAMAFLEERGQKDMVLMYCVSLYPTAAEDVNLAWLDWFQEEFGVLTGFSDHTAGSWAAPLAVARGARVIEKHFTIDKKLPGPDNALSANPAEFEAMIIGCGQAFQATVGNELAGDRGRQKEYAGHHWGRRGWYDSEGRDGKEKLVEIRREFLEMEGPRGDWTSWLTEQVEAGQFNIGRPTNGVDLFDIWQAEK